MEILNNADDVGAFFIQTRHEAEDAILSIDNAREIDEAEKAQNRKQISHEKA